eukprot:3599527-Amphidinium_carterae.1
MEANTNPLTPKLSDKAMAHRTLVAMTWMDGCTIFGTVRVVRWPMLLFDFTPSVYLKLLT